MIKIIVVFGLSFSMPIIAMQEASEQQSNKRKHDGQRYGNEPSEKK